jgi:hypothetical protein
MKDTANQFDRLAKREDFNASVRHIKATLSLMDAFSGKENLADQLSLALEEKMIKQDEISSIINMLLVEKFHYVAVSANISNSTPVLAKVALDLAKWNGVDFVIVYYHPDLGVMAINPKNAELMAGVEKFAKNELITVYAGAFEKEFDEKKILSAAKGLIQLVEGKSFKPDGSLLKGNCAYSQPKKKLPKAIKANAPKATRGRKKATAAQPEFPAYQAPMAYAPSAKIEAPAAPVAAPPTGAVKMTPMYAVPVTNELFHNGNVEAWKRIIESYSAKHPDLQVYVYYDGERITDLNSLFKWGKVKRGTCIEFKVAGENIVDVAKLQRYLRQGASHMFEAFLKFPVNSIAPLF